MRLLYATLLMSCVHVLNLVSGHSIFDAGSQSTPPTGNPNGCQNGTQFFRQPVWHASTNATAIGGNDTFLQQYQVITDHFQPGGPIFFYQGAESSILCAELPQFAEWAGEFGAMLVSIEHRYFGISMPLGLEWAHNVDWSAQVLASLTLENVQLDSVRLIEYIKRTIPGASNSPVIAFGGSYGGVLVTLHRTRYPDTFFGGIASSPPTHVVTDPASPDASLWGDWVRVGSRFLLIDHVLTQAKVSQVYLQHSAAASARICTGMDKLHSDFGKGKFAYIQDKLHLCTRPNSTLQLQYVLYAVAYSYGTVAQFGYNFPPLYNEPVPAIEYLINKTLSIAEDDQLAMLRPASDLEALYTGASCLDWEPDQLALQRLGSPFVWLWCTYFPYAKLVASADSIFGVVDPSEGQPRINDPMCQRRFGIDSISGGLSYEKQISIDPQTLQNTERLVMWYGGNDAVTSIGAVQHLWLPNGDPKRTQMVFATAAGHTQDILPSKANDTAALNSTRHFEKQAIRLWLGML